MTSTRAPIDLHAETELHRRLHAESPYWEMMYQAMLGQLANYVELAVAQALAAHGVGPGRSAAPFSDRGAPAPAHAAPERDRRHHGQGEGGPPASLSRSSLASAAIPPWLQPFTLPEKVRFTRTPDAFLHTERALPPEPRREELEEPEMAPEVALFEENVPAWRKPFTLPPNVRINRTPERRAVELDRSPKEEEPELDEGSAEFEADGGISLEPESEFADALEAGIAAVPELGEVKPQVPLWFGVIGAERSVVVPAAGEQDNARLGIAALEPSDGSLADEVIAAAWLMSQDERHLQPERSPQPTFPEPSVPPISESLGSQRSAAENSEPFPLFEPVVLRAQTAKANGRIVKAKGEQAPAARLGGAESPADVTPVLPEKPIGIASPEDAKAFVGPSRTGGRAEGNRTPQGLAPFEHSNLASIDPALWEDPPLELLVEPPPVSAAEELSSGALEQNARLLEGVLEEFGIRGEIIDVRPGPVVTLYELEPAPGTKSSRVIGLSDDIARSMSAISARVAVVQGRNVIGIELPNQRRETVFLRALLSSDEFSGSKHRLAIALGKTIGGEPITVDLARMPHLLVAGTTGSGKSVAINTMILSLLYRLRPEECRLIMIDPKMLELSVYEGIPHLLTPVVTDPKKAVVALKWAVREMEDRYKKMAKLGVRNIDGFNARVAEAAAKGETITRTVQTGFNRETGESISETEAMELSPLPYIVVIVDEMADLMMVAGKDIEGAIQRLAQMARAAGIHLIMATQRPSVDVITGTIKANFPTRISFQVTSKIDSRTILGEQGAEQLLGQGDMLYMAGGGRISRVHGPFVSDGEVEKVVAHLKLQGHPDYLDVVVAEEEAFDQKADVPDEKPVFERGAMGDEDSELYEQAVKVVLRDKKCSTSYIQRRLQVGYNKAASLVERMEKEGLVGQANNAGKREILVYSRDLRFTESRDGED